MKEFKVIKTTHSYSNLEDNVAFAIISTTYLRAEPDAVHGVYLDNEEDMFIIAIDMAEANAMLIDRIHNQICKEPLHDHHDGCPSCEPDKFRTVIDERDKAIHEEYYAEEKHQKFQKILDTVSDNIRKGLNLHD